MYKLVTQKFEPLPELANEWIYGKPGVGKSRSVRTRYDQSLFNKLPNKWWDGYNGEETVLIDDFSKQHSVLGYHLKIWADHYPFPAEVKGATTQIRPKRIIVTSNYHPNQIWDDKVLVEAVCRRFKMTYMPVENLVMPIVFNLKSAVEKPFE